MQKMALRLPSLPNEYNKTTRIGNVGGALPLRVCSTTPTSQKAVIEGLRQRMRLAILGEDDHLSAQMVVAEIEIQSIGRKLTEGPVAEAKVWIGAKLHGTAIHSLQKVTQIMADALLRGGTIVDTLVMTTDMVEVTGMVETVKMSDPERFRKRRILGKKGA
jgi:hypothetical protein